MSYRSGKQFHRLSPMVDISVVIPAYNEANYLPRLLDSIDQAVACFRGSADSVEIVVADNDSRDDTARIAMPILVRSSYP